MVAPITRLKRPLLKEIFNADGGRRYSDNFSARLVFTDDTGKRLAKPVAIDVKANTQCSGRVPDLVVEAVSCDVSEVIEAGSVTCHFTLRNAGQHKAHPSTTRLRLGRSPTRTSITDAALGDVAGPALEPGASATFDYRVTLPSSVGPGDYFVWVVADNKSANIETFSHNNFVRSGPVRVVKAGR